MNKYILVLFFSLFFSSFVYAEEFPSFPMSFWGQASLNGVPLPVNSKIYAYCNNDLSGSVVVLEEGVYGYQESLKQRLSVGNCFTKIVFKYSLPGNSNISSGLQEVYQQSFTEGETINRNFSFSSNQALPEEDGSTLINAQAPTLVVTDNSEQLNVTIGSDVSHPALDVSSLVSNGVGTLPGMTVVSQNANNVSMTISDSTTVTSSNPNWNGVIDTPTITSASIGSQASPFAIAVGYSEGKLSFDKAVRLLLPGQAGKRAGYIRTGVTFTEITTNCTNDSQATNNLLPADSDCKINVGSDLVIWTKHFTQFVIVPEGSQSGGGGSGGGDGGGSSGGGGGGGGGGTVSNPFLNSNISISINNGEESTISRNVSLGINGGSNAKKMAIVNGDSFDSSIQEDYATVRGWVLKEGDGVKKVCIKFYDSLGYSSDTVCDSIILGIKISPVDDVIEKPKTMTRSELIRMIIRLIIMRRLGIS